MVKPLADLDLEHLLKEISPESPCGENLEEDPLFLQLEDASRFVEERQMGDSIIPAEEPDWKVVRKLSLELLERSHDVQIAMHLLCALVRTDGFSGLEQGLDLIKGWLQDHWDEVYPLQDPEDDYPILRLNTLTSLNDYKLVIGPLNHFPLTQSPLGKFSWRDYEIAEGKITVSGNEESPDKAIIDAAFDDTDFAVLKKLEESVKNAEASVQEILSIVIDKAASVNAPDLSGLTNLLKSIDGLLIEKVQSREESRAESEAEVGGDMVETKPGKPARSTQAGVHSRDDVVRSIDELCRYFERYEPSSPVPFLLLRAKKLLTMNFIDILRDLTPDAVEQAERICGVDKKEED